MASPANPRPTSTLKVVLAYCVCFLTWGSTWSVAKVGLEDVPPLRLVGMRMLLAGVVLLPFARSSGRAVGVGTLTRIVGLGVLQLGIPFGMMFVGQQWLPSGWSALLFCTYPVWVLLVGRVLMPDQPLTPRKMLAAVLGLAGVASLQHLQVEELTLSGPVMLGGLLTLGSAGLISVANVLVKQHMAHVPPHLLVCVQTLSGALPLLGMSFLLESGMPVHWTLRAVLAVSWLALGGTVVTYLLLYWLLPRLSLSALGAMAMLDTLVAVILGVVILQEPLTLSVLLGGAFILTAAALANLPQSEAPGVDQQNTQHTKATSG